MTDAQNLEQGAPQSSIQSVTTQLAELYQMPVGQLRERFLELYGIPTHSRNKKYLQKKLAYRVQELAEGGLSGKALKRIDELAENAPIRYRQNGEGWRLEAGDLRSENGEGRRLEAGDLRLEDQKKNTTSKSLQHRHDPRLPAVGEYLTKTYKGAEYRVLVLDDGFEYDGRHFKSLSRIAREITHTVWNGFLFFDLTSRKAGDRRLEAEGQND